MKLINNFVSVCDQLIECFVFLRMLRLQIPQHSLHFRKLSLEVLQLFFPLFQLCLCFGQLGLLPIHFWLIMALNLKYFVLIVVLQLNELFYFDLEALNDFLILVHFLYNCFVLLNLGFIPLYFSTHAVNLIIFCLQLVAQLLHLHNGVLRIVWCNSLGIHFFKEHFILHFESSDRHLKLYHIAPELIYFLI